MKRFSRICLSLALAAHALPQTQNALLSTSDADQLFRRTVQLMESTTLAVPGLARAGAPVMENARQALVNLQNLPRNSAMTWDFLTNVRAFLTLSDSVPKPYPFPDEARRQFAELRDDADRIESHFHALLDQKELELRSPDRDNLRRYAEDDDRLGPAPPGHARIVFLGDSITDGWRLNEYFTGQDFVNRGISGQITGEMLGRMKADVLDLKPRAVLVLAGTNDIARGIPAKTIENNLTMIAELAQANNIKPMFASILPVSDYHKDVNPRFEMTKIRPPATIAEVNQWLQQFCASRGYTYVDYFSAMADKAGYLQADLADDGLHPNSKGYRIMAPVALAAIGKEVAEPAVSRKRRREPRAKHESAEQPAAAAVAVETVTAPEPEPARPPKRVAKPAAKPAAVKPAPAAAQPAAKPVPAQTAAAHKTEAKSDDTANTSTSTSTSKQKKKRYLKIFQ